MIVSRRVGVAVLTLVFVVALVYATPVQANKIVRWEYSVTMTAFPAPPPPQPTLAGWVKGDGMDGDMYWVNTGRFFAGETIHLYGYWWIEWEDGSVIKGTHTAVWALSNNLLNARGVVTAATPGYAHLIGRNIHTVEIFSMQTFSIGGIFQIN